MKRPRILTKLSAIFCLFVAQTAFGGSFTISSPSTTAQTLGSGAGQTGTITSTGSLTVSGGTVAVTISGNNATLTNSGTINQTGTGRAVRDNTGVTGLSITNNAGALMQTADADVIQMNKTPASVTLDNYGTMTSLNASIAGSQAVDFNAILSGPNTINNYSTGIMQARDADAVRPGVNGAINNYGMIKATHTTDTGDDGIDAQTNSGVTIHNFSTGSIEAARHGITGGNTTAPGAYTMSITNDSGGTIKGNDGAGINIDGLNANETVTVVNGGSITGNGVTGDGDGIDVDGLINLNNSGTIKSLNAFSSTTPAQSEGVTVGGGSITNSGTIEGDVASGNSNAVGRGITLAGVDTSGTPDPIYANSTVTNSGLIKGQTDSGIAVLGTASGFTVTINNQATGTIEGGGATAAAIQTGADNDTVNNAGKIIADSSGKAVDLGAGNDTLNITGGSAMITGGISGGTGVNALTIDPGVGNTFSYAGPISNFSSAEIKSGTVVLTGANTYSGNTLISGGSLFVNNGSGSATGAGRVVVSSGATLAGSGFIDSGANTITINGTLSPGNSAGTIHLASANANPGALLLGSTSTLLFDITNTSMKDLVSLTATNLTLGGGVLALNLPNTSLTGINYGDTYAIFTGINGSVVGAFGNVTGYDTTDYSAVFAQNGSDYDLSFTATTAVPEPGTWLGGALALGTLLLSRRRYAKNLKPAQS